MNACFASIVDKFTLLDCKKWAAIFLDLNLLDWSCNDYLAVALGGFVYLWHASSGSIEQLCQMDSSQSYVGSVSWINEGNYLAIGDSDGAVQVKYSFKV